MTASRITPTRLMVLLAIYAVFLMVGSVAPRDAAAAQSDDLVRFGERIYKQGIGVNGKPLAAIDISGQRVYAPQFHCVSCHRASGFGSREGGVFIPPIAATVLYKPMTPSRTRSFNSMYFQEQSPASAGRIYGARTRPAYDKASLGKLLRKGIDPAGAPIPNAMPRFDMSDRDVTALDAYLQTLSARPDPGVDDTTMHFALIVSDSLPAQTRKMLVDTTEAFATRYNSNASSEQARPNFSPFYRSDFVTFLRKWKIDVWELKGPQTSWPAQLEAYYRAQPAFAVIGGAVVGPWQPIGDFCDSVRLPCLFPMTDLPAKQAVDGGYTLYSYGGLPLEARALASYLGQKDRSGSGIIQLSSSGPQGSIPAASFKAAAAVAFPARKVTTEAVEPDGWDAALARVANNPDKPGTLVLWPGADSDNAIKAILAHQPRASLIVLPSTSLDAAVKALGSTSLAERIRVIDPRELPTVVNPHSYRVRAWLYARRVAVDPPEDQFQAYFALSVLEKAVMEIQGDYSRDYLIEEIEMIAESNLNPGVYPTLSLGPGQRIASRGSYIVKLDPQSVGGFVADGEWIVP